MNKMFTKTICMLSLMAAGMNAIAQGLETQSNTTGYIDCSHGVTVITQEVRMTENISWHYYYTFGESTLTAQSLYALDANGNPETLLWVRVPRKTQSYSSPPSGVTNWNSYYCEYSILPGTKRIAKGAFQYCGNIVQLHIPSSIRYIPENCFDGLNQYALIDINDDVPASIVSQRAPTTDSEEVARYNLQGQKVDEDEHGVQIIKYNNGSSKKIMNR